MQARGGRIVGLLTTAIGVVVVAIAVLLFGLAETANGETTVRGGVSWPKAKRVYHRDGSW